MATFESSLRPKLIYVFRINDNAHHGALKIGEATATLGDGYFKPNSSLLNKAAKERIDQYTKTAGISYQLLYTEGTMFTDGKGHVSSFNDKQVHKVLERSGIKRKSFEKKNQGREWYVTDLQTVKRAIAAVKEGRESLDNGEVTHEQSPIEFRPEQNMAIDRTIARFKRGNQMLWNAKMRFGKTLSALEVVLEMEMQRTIILTHRPVVDEGWFEDFQKIFFDQPDYHYGSRTKGESFQKLEQLARRGDSYVYFASMQDLRGAETVGGKFDKNADVFAAPWDMLIVDEAHEGTKTDIGQSVIDTLVKKHTKVLRLSGTPFNLLDDYNEEEIFTWDYVMEQRAKAEWDLTHMGDPNPYESLPAINIYTYDLGSLLSSEYCDDEKAFNFREFFRTRDDGTFCHDRDVDRFLGLMCKEGNLYPYSNDEFRQMFRHTLWVLPGVAAARTLSEKLRRHPVFGNFQVVNVAGNGDEDEENEEALKMVNKAIGPDPSETYTITLTCGRLTTGVSVKPWTAVFMMSGSFSTSAASYMQTIFRVQTPFTCHGQMKTNCYAFDFAPDRTLRVLAKVAKVSAKAGKSTDEDRKILGDFLNFCPIISIEGSQMKPYDVKSMMAQLKRAQIEKVVQNGFEDGALYNDELLKLTDVELQDFKDLKGKIGTTKAMAKTADIDVNNQGFTNEEYEEKERLEKKKKRELTPEEKARLEELKQKNNQRQNAISILRGISIRMPLLIYGAELKNEEDEITIDNFTQIVDAASWTEFMPKGVTKDVFRKFKKYYEADIFREAGKRIRSMARAADNLTVEERIERIATIFNTFRNPDKETVLTPWRVVNMHLGDCLGGYCFYDERYERMLELPRHIDNGKVTRDVFSPDSRVLEINSKSGLYPLFVAYNIYRRRMEEAREKYGDINRAFAQSLWDTTVEQNIFVICKTPMARSITRRTLVGFRPTRVNAQYYKDLIDVIKNNPATFVNEVRDGRRFWKANDKDHMTFNAIVGNPPYQVMDGGGAGYSALPVYQDFVNISRVINPQFMSLIIPARWYAGGKGLDNFRDTMLQDRRINLLFDFTESKDCFPSADIAGGICYFLWNRKYKGKCIVTSVSNNERNSNLRDLGEFSTFIRQSEAISIVHKIIDETIITLDNIVYSRKPFGLDNNFVGKQKPYDHCITVYGSQGISYADKDVVSQNTELIDNWKVIASKASAQGGRADKDGKRKVIPKIEVLTPNVVCTESYLLLSSFNNEESANNLCKYVKSKFFRFLLSLKVITQNISKDCFRFVPLQDFTSNSDIDWSRSIGEIDAQLYEKYGLERDEIDFIERMIKPIE
ncbi:DEAD/DEAH box helicase [Prevotella sp. P5-92]|uniref:Eco57I restriction-modification methylase domain-containing protein n=1 Tax=Prevotella sp. P5-92 TaxID=2024222 RepID=UPI000B9607FC|nr:Eco57I restriction-modification methylase domain-containing protein [Prevotella sp. P5-92]OYP56726.1 DEAD/DEAH box helicase [Prevotella sp. P5-92]